MASGGYGSGGTAIGGYGSGGAAIGGYGSAGAPDGAYGSFEAGNGPGSAALPPLNASSTLPGSFDPKRRPDSEHSLLRRGSGYETASNNINVWELIFVPWCIVVVVLLCFFQAGAYGYYWTVGLIPAILLPLISLFLLHSQRRERHAEVVLGLLCLVAAVLSLTVGSYAVARSLVEYHRLSQGASYVNVLASEAGGSRLDATTLSFTNQTLVDVSRTFGFTDARSQKATTYCVAPVSDGNLYGRRVQFWAAGVDCCEARSNFNCFSPDSIGAHGALVLPKDQQRLLGYDRAIRGAQSAYDLTAGDSYLLVQWHEDPVGYRNGLWNNTVNLFGIIAGAYLIISVMVGCTVLPVVNSKADKACGGASTSTPAAAEMLPLSQQASLGRAPSASPGALGGADAKAAAAAADGYAGYGTAMGGGGSGVLEASSASTLPASSRSRPVLPVSARRGFSRSPSPGACC